MSWAPFLAPSRSEAAAMGRTKVSTTVHYLVPDGGIGANTESLILGNADVYVPVFLSSPYVVDQLAFEVTSGVAGNMRVGLYAADRNLQPIGPPLADSGNIDVTGTGVKTYAPGTPIYLPAGRYLSVVNGSVQPTLRYYRGCGHYQLADTTMGANVINSLSVSRTYAAFTTPGTAWTTLQTGTSGGFHHYVVLRASAA